MAKQNKNKSFLIIPPVPNRRVLNGPLIDILNDIITGA